MADFKTHISTSTAIGIGYGVAGYMALEAPITTCVLSGGLCSVAGMLPDLDSDSGVPVREMMSLAAAVVPMLMMDRFIHLGFSHEMMVVAGGVLYFTIRFGVAEIFKRYTVHRGMWHSLPAAAVAGLLAFLICSCDDTAMRWYKAGGVVLGFLSHLVLDELWAIDIKRGGFRFKKSFGTAFKLWSGNTWANVSTYAKLILVAGAAFYDPIAMEQFAEQHRDAEHTARERLDEIHEKAEHLLR
jgi:membrane-bound metal-dependent hydrolase YbcI (DUF457 family)